MIGNMSGEYTIFLDPNVQPVQHTLQKLPIKSREKIEKILQELADQQVKVPITQATEWVSALKYPQKPGGSLCICLISKT